jgi:DNA-binding transcriptional ArsR family regulator
MAISTAGPACAVTVMPSVLLAASGLVAALDGELFPHAATESLRQLPGWLGARALLVHGIALRDHLAAIVARGDSVPLSLGEMRPWLVSREEPFYRRLLLEAALGGLQYYRDHLDPNPLVEAVRARWPNPLPPLDDLMEMPDLARDLVVTQTITWAAATPAAMPLVADPRRLAVVVAGALEHVWRKVAAGIPLAPVPDLDAVTAPGAVEQFTGRPVPPELERALSDAERLVLIPTPGFGPHVAPWSAPGSRMHLVWAEPRAAARAEPPQAPPPEHVGGPLDSERREHLMRALADPTAAGILDALANAGPLPAHQLARMLGVHPSTISRQLRRLVDLSVLHAEVERTRVVYHARWTALDPVRRWLARLSDSGTAD